MKSILVDAALTKSFVRELLVRHGADGREAEVVTDVLIWCESRGHVGQGIDRVPTFLKRLRGGGIVSPCHAEFSRLGRAADSLDGRGGFGQYLAVMAVRRAIDLALREGMSIVTVRNSNHFGAAGYYANLAAQDGMVAIVTSNSFAAVAAYGGLKPVLGTNPMAFAAPRKGREPLVIDMGTTFGSRTAALTRASDTMHVADGLAVDRQGGPVKDTQGLHDPAILPSGPKEFALGLVVEILSGVLTGAGYSRGLRSFYREPGQPGNLGHLFICFRIETFMRREIFLDRMEHLIELLGSSGDMNPECPVRLPGEKRWDFHRKNEAAGVIPIREQTVAALDERARRVDMLPLRRWSDRDSPADL